jgi:tetratricopeptide (TPR) repeat protein
MLSHAANCGNCADKLAGAIRILSEDETPGENAAIASLGSARPDWQARMAMRLAASAKVRRPIRLQPRAWLAAAAALILGVAVFWWSGDTVPVELLAKAYSDERSFELRIPGAAYAPLRVERSAAHARSAELAESEALIERRLVSHPADAEWLLAKGRADLLEWNYAEAIQILQGLLDRTPESAAPLRADVCVDLATAYFQRGESSNNLVDLSLAADLLGRAIRFDGSRAVAYFNRAIVFEKLLEFDKARDDWERYLQLDSKGGWHDEAEQRLVKLKNKMHAGDRGIKDGRAGSWV